ncbi:MAG TPA: response regulator, partial [Verrucomicrobiae bacterium]|nr:response regulator [Verrucomicrobiae bacterium]
MNENISCGNSLRAAQVSAGGNSRGNVLEQSVRGGREGADVSRPNAGKAKRILVVVEEPLVRVAILNNLRRVGFAVDVASNGSIALEKLRSGDPDAIFLDLMLPDIDGVEVIEEVRREPEYSDLPIYIYSSAFPMKMSRRAAKAGVTRIFDKISTPLDEVVAEVASQLIGVRPTAAEADAFQSDPTDSEVLKEIAAKLPESVGRLHRHLQELVRCKDNAARAAKCGELRSRVHLVVNYAILAGRYDMARPAATLQSLLNALREKPRYATESSVRTISLAVEVLGLLCRGNAAGHGSRLTEFTAVVVDDELTSRSVVGSALRSMGFKLNNFVDPTQALKHLQSHSTDLVVLKVRMREMGGFDMCKKLRSLPLHKRTPAILVGGPNDVESAERAASCGGSDLIITPFIFIELALKAICLVLKNRPSSRVESAAITTTTPAPQTEQSAADRQEERPIGAVPARQPAGVATGVRKSNATLYRAGEELKRRVQAASVEAATPRRAPEEKRQERGQSQILSDRVELDQLRTALEQERQQRQRLEVRLQEMAAPQPTTSGDRRGDDVWGKWVPPATAATGAESNTASDRAGEELKKRLHAASSDTAMLREALQTTEKDREELSARILSDRIERDQLRTVLERERQQRQQLENTLQEITARQAERQVEEQARLEPDLGEQLTAAKAAAEKAEMACREEAQRSSRFEEELATLHEALEKKQKEREELSARIFSDETELGRVRTTLEQERQQRQQLETQLQELTARQAGRQVEQRDQAETEQREPWNDTDAGCQEDAQWSKRFEEELATLQQQRDELTGQLTLAQQAAADAGQHSTGLETRLGETNEDLERAKTELEQERQQRQQLETQLQELTARQAEPENQTEEQAETEKREPWNVTEAARHEEDQLGDRFEEELTTLREALEKKQKEREELSARIFSDGVELDQLRTTLEQERQQRQQLETQLQELTVHQAERQVEEQAEAERREPWNATARREADQQSGPLEQELTTLQQQRDELGNQLALAQQEAAESKRRSEELENRLRESTVETERVKTEHSRLESELGGQLKAAKAATEKAEAARGE